MDWTATAGHTTGRWYFEVTVERFVVSNARVRAVMRRADETMGKTYEDDHLSIDFDDIRVACDGVKIKLTNKEFTLLSVLARSPDRVVTRQQLLDSVWGYSYYGDARTLDVHIRRLRQAIAPAHVLGRVNASVRVTEFGAVLLGTVIAGYLGETVGLRETLESPTFLKGKHKLPIPLGRDVSGRAQQRFGVVVIRCDVIQGAG